MLNQKLIRVKRALLYAAVSFLAMLAVGLIVAMTIDVIPSVRTDYEGVGLAFGLAYIFLVGPLAFLYGFRRQRKTDAACDSKN